MTDRKYTKKRAPKKGPPTDEAKTDASVSHAMMVNNVYYSITLCGSDCMQFWNHSGPNRIKNCISAYENSIQTYIYPYVSDYLFVPEISKKGRVHLHGYLKFSDVFLFHLNSIHNLNSIMIVDIDTIDDMIKWKEYIYKDKEIMKKPLRRITGFYELKPVSARESLHEFNLLLKEYSLSVEYSENDEEI